MKQTQGALLAAWLKRAPHTYGQMQRLGISVAPQLRVMEWLRLHDGWQLEKGKVSVGGRELVTWRIVRS